MSPPTSPSTPRGAGTAQPMVTSPAPASLPLPSAAEATRRTVAPGRGRGSRAVSAGGEPGPRTCLLFSRPRRRAAQACHCGGGNGVAATRWLTSRCGVARRRVPPPQRRRTTALGRGRGAGVLAAGGDPHASGRASPTSHRGKAAFRRQSAVTLTDTRRITLSSFLVPLSLVIFNDLAGHEPVCVQNVSVLAV